MYECVVGRGWWVGLLRWMGRAAENYLVGCAVRIKLPDA